MVASEISSELGRPETRQGSKQTSWAELSDRCAARAGVLVACKVPPGISDAPGFETRAVNTYAVLLLGGDSAFQAVGVGSNPARCSRVPPAQKLTEQDPGMGHRTHSDKAGRLPDAPDRTRHKRKSIKAAEKAMRCAPFGATPKAGFVTGTNSWVYIPLWTRRGL